MTVLLLLWSALKLSRIAGHDSKWASLIVFFLILTFGPTFLTLSLGQNSTLLLVAALIAGEYALTNRAAPLVLAGLTWAMSIVAKLFPLLWLVILPLLGRWRFLLLTVAIAVALNGVVYLYSPQASQDYWTVFLRSQMTEYSDEGGIDNQSLVSWFLRLGRRQTYDLTGMTVENRHLVVWNPPWEVPVGVLTSAAYALLFVTSVPVLFVIWRNRRSAPDGAIFLWLLFTSLLVPHMVRYNHVLLLPAMAWLWSRGIGGRVAVCLAYFLTGADRLTHLWAILLPTPLAPLASGCGIVAAFGLVGTMVWYLWPNRRDATGVAESKVSHL